MVSRLKVISLGALRGFIGLAGLAVLISAYRHGKVDLMLILHGALFSLLSGAFVATDHLYARETHQWAEDLTPATCAEIVGADECSYCLVLRGFSFDSRVELPNDFNPFRWLPVGFGVPMIDAQEWLLRASGPKWRFFSWGGSVGAIRPARVVAGIEWRSGVEYAIRHADVIFVIPGTSPSLTNEISFALEHRPHHLVFVFPPPASNKRLYLHLKSSTLLESYARAVPPTGCLLLPFRHDDGTLRLVTYPISRHYLHQILEARAGATTD